jgi:hypothetical protein
MTMLTPIHPWKSEPIYLGEGLDKRDVTLLRDVYLGSAGDGPWMAYGSAINAAAKRCQRLAVLGLVEFSDWRTQHGWERGMWVARLTSLGANAVFRSDADYAVPGEGKRDRHPGCGGHWLLEGTCSRCGSFRPLDADAYDDYLGYLSANEPDAYETQIMGPRLWCTEHGHLRTRHITTQKICLQPGTHLHDGGLQRI